MQILPGLTARGTMASNLIPVRPPLIDFPSRLAQRPEELPGRGTFVVVFITMTA